MLADLDLDGSLDLVIANGHIDETVRNIRGNVGYAQPPHLFINQGDGTFRDRSTDAGADFAQPRIGRGLACADITRDGTLDVLLTTNNGPVRLFKNEQLAGNRSLRLRLVGTTSNRDGIGATIRVTHGGTSQSRVVKSGSSYLSQSELPVTFGVGRRDRVERIVVSWPSGRTEDFPNLATGKAYECVEGQGLSPASSASMRRLVFLGYCPYLPDDVKVEAFWKLDHDLDQNHPDARGPRLRRPLASRRTGGR